MTGQPPLAEILEFRSRVPSADAPTCEQLLHEVESHLLDGEIHDGLLALRQALQLMDRGDVSHRHACAPLSRLKPMQVYTLGRFSILLNGKPLVFNQRSQEKPIELLKLLISLGGREINKAHAAELLWPDSQGDMANQALATTLCRLRKLVGKECVWLKAGKLTINADYCWVDIWHFERLLNQVKNASKEVEPECFQEAMDLYRGSFLTEEDHGWAIPRRERLRQKFLMSLNEVASRLSRQQGCAKAIPLYQKALEVDELSEELYLGLMHCYVKLDRWVDALAIYRRCRDTLQEVLSVEPGLELQGLYEKLKTSGLSMSVQGGVTPIDVMQ